MFDQDKCGDCANPENKVVSSPLLMRAEALSLYVRLHRQEQSPAMCEQPNGKWRVCYSVKSLAMTAACCSQPGVASA